jgi:hypothetical protein
VNTILSGKARFKPVATAGAAKLAEKVAHLRRQSLEGVLVAHGRPHERPGTVFGAAFDQDADDGRHRLFRQVGVSVRQRLGEGEVARAFRGADGQDQERQRRRAKKRQHQASPARGDGRRAYARRQGPHGGEMVFRGNHVLFSLWG